MRYVYQYWDRESCGCGHRGVWADSQRVHCMACDHNTVPVDQQISLRTFEERGEIYAHFNRPDALASWDIMPSRASSYPAWDSACAPAPLTDASIAHAFTRMRALWAP